MQFILHRGIQIAAPCAWVLAVTGGPCCFADCGGGVPGGGRRRICLQRVHINIRSNLECRGLPHIFERRYIFARQGKSSQCAIGRTPPVANHSNGAPRRRRAHQRYHRGAH